MFYELICLFFKLLRLWSCSGAIYHTPRFCQAYRHLSCSSTSVSLWPPRIQIIVYIVKPSAFELVVKMNKFNARFGPISSKLFPSQRKWLKIRFCPAQRFFNISFISHISSYVLPKSPGDSRAPLPHTTTPKGPWFDPGFWQGHRSWWLVHFSQLSILRCFSQMFYELISLYFTPLWLSS